MKMTGVWGKTVVVGWWVVVGWVHGVLGLGVFSVFGVLLCGF